MYKIFLMVLFSMILAEPAMAAEDCTNEVGYFHQTKLAYEKNHKLIAPKVRCLALAGDDRAATLYAEYLLEKYNNNGYKEDIYASYAWYKIAVDRSSSPGSWKKMPKILEGAVPGIEESSQSLYQQLQQQVAAKKRFDEPSTIDIPEETDQERKRRIRKAKESGAARVPSHRQ